MFLSFKGRALFNTTSSSLTHGESYIGLQREQFTFCRSLIRGGALKTFFCEGLRDSNCKAADESLGPTAKSAACQGVRCRRPCKPPVIHEGAVLILQHPGDLSLGSDVVGPQLAFCLPVKEARPSSSDVHRADPPEEESVTVITFCLTAPAPAHYPCDAV